MNRFVSNFILGFFALALMAVYGFAKQPTVYSMMTRQTKSVATTESTKTVSTERRVILPNGTTVLAKVAETDLARKQGLSGVEKLDQNSGMLFVFDKSGTYSMWMKDMKIPLDIIWLDEQGRVVHLANAVQPPKDGQTDLKTYENDQPATYVLELPAGTAESVGLKEGDQVKLT